MILFLVYEKIPKFTELPGAFFVHVSFFVLLRTISLLIKYVKTLIMVFDDYE